jgi:uncharacterized membrane protein
MSYNAFKVMHLLGVVMFLGNIIVTALWKAMADQTNEPHVIAFAQRLVTLTDCIFTGGGVVLSWQAHTEWRFRPVSTRARHGSSRIFGAWHNNVTC